MSALCLANRNATEIEGVCAARRDPDVLFRASTMHLANRPSMIKQE
jgi:hypothetical protein